VIVGVSLFWACVRKRAYRVAGVQTTATVVMQGNNSDALQWITGIGTLLAVIVAPLVALLAHRLAVRREMNRRPVLFLLDWIGVTLPQLNFGTGASRARAHTSG
jgi:hypothetical protein